MTWISHVRPEDLPLSGPKVWPKIVAEEQCDLFIFRRPELPYLEALRRKRREEEKSPWKSDKIVVDLKRMVYEGKKLSPFGASTSFWHKIQENQVDDVRAYLLELRMSAQKIMPNGPCPSAVLLVAIKNERGKRMIRFQETWI